MIPIHSIGPSRPVRRRTPVLQPIEELEEEVSQEMGEERDYSDDHCVAL